MPAPGARPPTLGELLAQGVLDDIVEEILQLVPPGETSVDVDTLYQAIADHTPALLPSTFNALLRRVQTEVDRILQEIPPDQGDASRLGRIPLQPERRNKAGDYAGRILYRVTVNVPDSEGGIVYRTVYIESGFPLTLEQITAEALALVEAAFGEHPGRYQEFDQDWLNSELTTITIEDISRSF